jgi:hypothetical protein
MGGRFWMSTCWLASLEPVGPTCTDCGDEMRTSASGTDCIESGCEEIEDQSLGP